MIQPITLGELIKQLSHCAPSAFVEFDFCGQRPTKLDSYRGYYDQLALGWASSGEITVEKLLEECKGAIGKTYEGYKGGNYRMDEETPVWVANYSHCDGTAIKKVKRLGEHRVVIVTRHTE